MQVLECKRKESHQAALEQRIVELEAELAREKLVRERSSMENVSQNGSTSRHHESPRSEENYVETNHEDGACEDNSNEYEYMLVRRTNLAPPVQQPHRSNSSSFVQPITFPAGSFMQRPHSSPIPTTTAAQPHQSSSIPTAPGVQSTQYSPDGAAPSRNVDANHISHDDLISREVILYALHTDEVVAKGIVIIVNPTTIHVGQALGRKNCEVVIKFVMKRDAKLPRPYPGVQEMADAKDLSIAWPYNRLKVCKTKKSSHRTGCGRK